MEITVVIIGIFVVAVQGGFRCVLSSTRVIVLIVALLIIMCEQKAFKTLVKVTNLFQLALLLLFQSKIP